MVRTGIDPTLARTVVRGEYVVDAHAVAEAMLRRRSARRDSASGVLVAPKPEWLPRRS